MDGQRTRVDPRLVLVIAVAVGLWAPLTRLDWFDAHEHISYVLRTVEWAAELRAGELYPRWAPDLYGGYGSPFFMFFAPVPYGIAGLLTGAFFSPFTSLKILALFGSVLAGVGTYALVYGETRQRDAALLGAVAYLAAPYRLGDIYERGDLGEFTCIALLPVVLALYRAVAREPRPLCARWLAAAASVFHALMIMTHPVLGLWGTLLVGMVVAATALRLAVLRAWRHVALLVFAVACAPGLAGIYVIPAMVYRSTAQTAKMIVGFYRAQDHWITIDTLFAKNTMLFPRNFLQVGQIVVAACVVVAIGLLVNFRKGRAALGWMALAFVLIGLNLGVGSGFWAPGRVPLAEFTQFPFRLLGPVALLASLGLGIGMAAACEKLSESMRTSLAIAGSTGFLLVLAWPFTSALAIPLAGIPTDSDTIRQGIYAASDANEFLPVGAAVPAAPRQELVADSRGAVVEFSHSDGSHHELVLRVKKRGARVRLALNGFPGWRVTTVSGAEGVTLETDRHGLLFLRLPAAGVYKLRLWFGGTLASRLGALLSVVSALALAALLAHGTGFWPAWPRIFQRAGRAPRLFTREENAT